MNNLAEQLIGAAKNADHFVRSSPWQAVGAVTLIGAAAGFLVSMGLRLTQRRPDTPADADSFSEVAGG